MTEIILWLCCFAGLAGGTWFYIELFAAEKQAKSEKHIEQIKCPMCHHVQDADVLHTIPYHTYIHHCENCYYIIMESDWEKVKK